MNMIMIDKQSCQLTRNFGPKPEFGPNGLNDPKKAQILAFWPDFLKNGYIFFFNSSSARMSI